MGLYGAKQDEHMRVLIVEDEKSIQDVIRIYLTEHGLETVTASSGPEALSKINDAIDLMVLDLQLPGMDGLDVVRNVRSFSPVPILILSARSDASDRIAGLELGADDYLIKPFIPRELVARVRALLRRARMPAVGAVKAGPLTIDPEARRVSLEGETVELAPREYEMLRVLCQARGKTFSREELLDRIWGPEYIGDTRRVDLCISRLRTKLQRPGYSSPIRSIWGVGYRFEGS